MEREGDVNPACGGEPWRKSEAGKYLIAGRVREKLIAWREVNGKPGGGVSLPDGRRALAQF